MGRPLTARQQQVYDYIREKISTRGYGPTVREIGEFIGIKSPNGVMCHLRALERKGMISRIANKSRAIELTGSAPIASPPLEVRGVIESGSYRSFDKPTMTQVLSVFAHPERFLLYYRGSTLGNHAIVDGDILLVQESPMEPPSGLMMLETLNRRVELRMLGAAAAESQSLPGGQDVAGNVAGNVASNVTDNVDGHRVLGYVVGVIRALVDIPTAQVHPAHAVPAAHHVASAREIERVDDPIPVANEPGEVGQAVNPPKPHTTP